MESHQANVIHLMLVRLFACLLLVCVTLHARASSISVVDDRGKRLSLTVPAQRIVTLAPSLAELVYAAGAGAQLIGVARFSDYPPPVGNLPQIGDATRVDLERILSLKPDLIVAWKSGNHTADYERLERLGFKVFVVEPARLQAIPRLLREIGTLTGSAPAAAAAALAFENGIAALRARFSARSTVRVFYEIWHEPLMTVSSGHIISDVIELCGGNNVFAHASSLAPLVSLESVIAARPQAVLGGSSAITPGEFLASWKRYEEYAGLRGVTAIFIDPDRIQRHTPRILLGARDICEQLDAVRGRRDAGQRAAG